MKKEVTFLFDIDKEIYNLQNSDIILFKKKCKSRINLNEEEIIDPYALSKISYHELGIYRLH